MKTRITSCALMITGLSVLFSENALCQNLTGDSLEISGTANINSLEVTDSADFQNNFLYFGTSGTTPALAIEYNETPDGQAADFSLTSANPFATWTWKRMVSESTRTVLQLDQSNRLILSGTDQTNPAQIILDPNTGISLNGSGVLTQATASSMYFPSNAGLYSVDGRIGIGTNSPQAALDVLGDGRLTGSLELFDSGTSTVPSLALSGSTGDILIGGEALTRPVYGVGSAVSGLSVSGNGSFKLYTDWYWKNDPLGIFQSTGENSGSIVAPANGIYHCALQLWTDFSPSKDCKAAYQIFVNGELQYEWSTKFGKEHSQCHVVGSPYTFFLPLKKGDKVSLKVANATGNNETWTQKARLKIYASSNLPSWFGTGGNAPFPDWTEDGTEWFFKSFNHFDRQWQVTENNSLVTDYPVGINTPNPQALLHVAGNARFDGPIRIEPQGDLSMGPFTNEPSEE